MQKTSIIFASDEYLAEINGGISFYTVCLIVAATGPAGIIVGSGMALGYYMNSK